MAFATTNVQKTYFGNLKVTYGDWSGAVADAAGSVVVEGGRVYIAWLSGQDSTGAYVAAFITPFSVTTSGNVSTVTFYNLDTVTQGRFMIIHS